ncbi:MAG: RNA polymerase sigma factor [Bryobacteraceae bacterium]|jgi:RNA polymerase sigma-70 factor (ECF subfamily)
MAAAQPSTPERVQSFMGGATATLDGDAELMRRVGEGDDASFGLLLNKHRAPIAHFLYRMVQDRAAAEELAQEVFLRVYRSRSSYEATAKFTTWLFRIATHLALNWLRDEKGGRAREMLGEVIDSRPSVEQSMVQAARLNEVRRAVAALPEKQRAAVLMHKYEEMDYSQIAKTLDCSESAVKSLLFRAYETLRARLAHMAS